MGGQTSQEMAGSSQPTFLWDGSQEDNHGKVKENRALCLKMRDIFSSHLSKIVIDNDFVLKALEKQVIGESCAALLQDPEDVTSSTALLNEILQGHMYQLHGFLWVLVNTDQSEFVRMLGFEPSEYLDTKLLLGKSQFYCQACKDFYNTRAYVMTRCGHYVCAQCIKGLPQESFRRDINGMDHIECPLEGCGQITEVVTKKDQSICLEFDEAFEELADLMKEAEGKVVNECSHCTMGLRTSPVKHYCKQCEKTYCSGCYMNHQYEHTFMQHETIHQHHRSLCCEHGNRTTAFCKDCNIYFCEVCVKTCKHDGARTTEIERHETTAALTVAIQNCIKGKSENEAKCKDLQEKLLPKEGALKAKVMHEMKRIKRWVDDWVNEQLRNIDSAKQAVNTRVSQGTKWKCVLRDLQMLLEARPWLYQEYVDTIQDILTRSPGGVNQDTTMFINLVEKGAPKPEFMLPPLYCRIPPSKGTLIAEWKSEGGCLFGLDWTREGDLLIAQHEKDLVIRLRVDVEKGEIKPPDVIESEHKPTDVACHRDGTVFVSCSEGIVLVYGNDETEKPIEWRPDNIEKPWCIACNEDYIFVTEAEGGVVYVYDLENRALVASPSCCPSPGVYRLSATRTKVIATCASNELYSVNLTNGNMNDGHNTSSSNSQGNIDFIVNEPFGLGTGEREKKRGEHPRGLCTYQNRYVLVCDQNEDRLSVYTLDDGEFVNYVSFDKGVHGALSVAILHRLGEPALLAVGSNHTLKIFALE